ncbi:DUF917 domain-containing protein [Sphingobium sp. SCG-1]|nr:DUF917 domain-containing protein [Sphingobium sp. SCG-1]
MYEVTSQIDISDMARGAVFLGAGGGGDPYVGELFVSAQIEAGRFPRVAALDEIADDALVVSIAGMGAPTILVENLISERALLELVRRTETLHNRKVDALISIEMGGVNSMFPLGLGARLGLPVIDADGMGRAFPHLEMTSFSVYGCRASPLVLLDDLGSLVTIDVVDDRRTEELARTNVVAMGALLNGSFYPMSGADAKRTAVAGTITQTLEIGRAIREARHASADPVHALLAYLDQSGEKQHARLLFEGKIADVSHETRDGWHWGQALVRNASGDELKIDIQNEYIVARRNGRTVTVVPDIIATLDRESAEPLTAEMLRYGQRIAVVGFSAAPIMRRAEGLAVFGPRKFKLDEDFVGVEDLVTA